ncbi:MAG: RICIN domain-containing protein [Acidimicrobiales bacterium]
MLHIVRTRVATIAVAIVGVVSMFAALVPGGASAAAAQTGEPAGTPVVAAHSGQALDVSGISTVAGAPVIQWPPNGQPNQHWTFEPLGDGSYRIVAGHSGLVLDVFGASPAAGAQVIQWPWNGDTNQRWRLEDVPGEGSRIVAVHSGMALDVTGASQQRGARMIQWPANGDANQRWLRTDGGLDGGDVLGPDIDTEAEVAGGAQPPVSVTDVRLGRHNGFDRVVFDIGGEGQAGWDVRYVDEARAAGSGQPIDLGGEAVLEVRLTNIALPPNAPDGVEPWAGPDRLQLPGAGPVVEVAEDTVFEGAHTFFVGVTERVPFQVNRLGSPQRVVLDVAAP